MLTKISFSWDVTNEVCSQVQMFRRSLLPPSSGQSKKNKPRRRKVDINPLALELDI